MVGTLVIRNILVYGILIYFLVKYGRANNLWGVKKTTVKTTKVVRDGKSEVRKRNRVIRVLTKLEEIGLTLGSEPTQSEKEYYTFAIRRLQIEVKRLGNRELTALELIGLLKVIKYVSSFLMILGILIYKKPILAVFGVGVFVEPLLQSYIDMKIVQQDKEIEEDFPELYQLLYSRLLKGTDTRIGPTLQDYLESIDMLHGPNSHKSIRAFVVELQLNIELYGDDTQAIRMLRDVYKSAMLVNFFNLATQSLSGVENERRLTSFKDELQQQREQRMVDKANRIGDKGERAVNAIYIILAQFVILSWVAKTGGLGGISNIFG